MARVQITVIDVPDHQVEAILRTVQIMAGAPLAVPAASSAPPQLPAPIPVCDHVPEPAAAVGVVRPAFPKVRKVKSAASPRDGSEREKLVAELHRGPGTARELDKRLGWSSAKTSFHLGGLRKAGVADSVKRVWSLRNGAAKSQSQPVQAPPTNSVSVLIRERLARGSASESELLSYCAAAGQKVPDRFAISKVLDNMDRAGEVIGAAGERWTLAKGAVA